LRRAEALTRVTAPTLFLTGELEDPKDATAEAAARMPNGTRYRIPGQGHITPSSTVTSSFHR
jgi:pimeloyl-ACP methyl ester carboxylesterase